MKILKVVNSKSKVFLGGSFGTIVRKSGGRRRGDGGGGRGKDGRDRGEGRIGTRNQLSVYMGYSDAMGMGKFVNVMI